MAIGDIWHIAAIGKWNLQQYVDSFHIKFLSVGATPAGAVSYLNTNYFQLVKTKQSAGLTGYTIHAVQLMNAPPVYDTTISADGTSGLTEPLPNVVAIVASLRTGYAGRSFRGRKYLAGFTEGQNDTTVDDTLRGALQTYFDDLVAGIGEGGASTDYQWGVWSRKLGQPSPGSWNYAAGWKPITEVIVRDDWGTQRRRRFGVGA